MAVPTPENIMRLKGRFVKDPSDLTAAYPYGGTALGIIGAARFLPGVKSAPLPGEEFGNVITEVLTTASAGILMAPLRSYDGDLLPQLFSPQNSTAGSSSGEQVVAGKVASTAGAVSNSDGSPGKYASADSFKLMFCPDAEDHQPFLIFYNAMPLVQEAAEIQLTLPADLEIAVAFHAAPDATYRTYAWGLREDLTL